MISKDVRFCNILRQFVHLFVWMFAMKLLNVLTRDRAKGFRQNDRNVKGSLVNCCQQQLSFFIVVVITSLPFLQGRPEIEIQSNYARVGGRHSFNQVRQVVPFDRPSPGQRPFPELIIGNRNEHGFDCKGLRLE